MGDVGGGLVASLRVGQAFDEGVFWRQDHERGPEQGIGTGREDAQRVAAWLVLVGRDLEVDLGPFGPADPVGLLNLDWLRPVDPGEVQELIGIASRAQEPLLQVALLDEGTTPPAMAVGALDLLAGQGPVIGAPVDRG